MSSARFFPPRPKVRPMPSRRRSSAPAWHGSAPKRRTVPPREPGTRNGGRRLRLGWKGWLVVDSLVVLLVVAGVVAWPPIQACRYQDQTVGFYAGDSVGKCIRRGIADASIPRTSASSA